MTNAALLLCAAFLDAAFGEPDWLWRRCPHPAVLMGRLITWGDDRFNRGDGRRLKGGLFILMSGFGLALIGFVPRLLPNGWIFEIVLAAILLAQRSLADHVRAVANALDRSLPEGRRTVGQIVGRRTVDLDRPAVVRAAIESGAENFSDGVIAPAFWFLVGGLPGLILYKFVNTADSMIGHRTVRHAEFGWAAARLDDGLNLIPSRLSAVLIAIAAIKYDPLRASIRDARLHRSPNAGWPEVAMAAALNVALGGPRVYEEGPVPLPWLWAEGRRDPDPDDIRTAVRMLWRAWFAGILLIAPLALL